MKKFAVVTSVAVIALAGGSALANMHGGNWEEKFEKVDTSNDGKISMGEWNAHGKVWFDKIDANKDGNITKAEKQAFKEEMHDKNSSSTEGDNRSVNKGKISDEAIKSGGKDEDGQKAVER